MACGWLAGPGDHLPYTPAVVICPLFLRNFAIFLQPVTTAGEVAPWKREEYASDVGSVMQHVIIEEGVTSIGRDAFYKCKTMEDISIPGTVKYINNGAFYYCFNLGSLVIPEGVEHISVSAFAYCTKLASVSLPESLQSIDQGAFSYCTKLQSMSAKHFTSTGKHQKLSDRSVSKTSVGFSELLAPL